MHSATAALPKAVLRKETLGGFVAGDVFQVVVEGVRECCFDVVSLGVVGETFAVELVLEVLEGESVVEDANFKM